jgi:hypothetical protein
MTKGRLLQDFFMLTRHGAPDSSKRGKRGGRCHQAAQSMHRKWA